jgi:hypothetical protein
VESAAAAVNFQPPLPVALPFVIGAHTRRPSSTGFALAGKRAAGGITGRLAPTGGRDRLRLAGAERVLADMVCTGCNRLRVKVAGWRGAVMGMPQVWRAGNDRKAAGLSLLHQLAERVVGNARRLRVLRFDLRSSARSVRSVVAFLSISSAWLGVAVQAFFAKSAASGPGAGRGLILVVLCEGGIERERVKLTRPGTAVVARNGCCSWSLAGNGGRPGWGRAE